jgi:hypothetical protein
VVCRKKLKKVKGLYEELLRKGDNSPWMKDIVKDLDRTFPTTKYFDEAKRGEIGMQALKNVLQAYSVYKPDVGYCQSMNFVVGFMLMANGGNEHEAFWMLSAFGQRNVVNSPKFEGLDGFYSPHFPLL